MKQIIIINENDGDQFAYVDGELHSTASCFRPWEIAAMANGDECLITQIDVHAHDEPEPDEPPEPLNLAELWSEGRQVVAMMRNGILLQLEAASDGAWSDDNGYPYTADGRYLSNSEFDIVSVVSDWRPTTLVATVDVAEPPPQSIQTGTIDDFAEKYGLLLRADPCSYPADRYTAHLSGVEVVQGHAFIGVLGSGATPMQAIDDYARKISGQTLRLPNGDRVQAWIFTE